jgi:proline iminopeptidase
LASPVIDVPRYLTAVRRRVEELTPDLPTFMQAEADPRKRTPAYAQVVHDFIGRNVCRRKPLPDCLTKGFQLVNRAAHVQMKGGLLFYTTPMAQLDLTAQLPTLDVPTLITCGEHDPTTPEACGAFQSRMRDCELAVLPNCSHMPHLEDSRAYADVVGRFLDAVDQRPQA